MEGYGCIGKKLPHSFSADIHRFLGKYPYELIELAEDKLGAFLKEKNFRGLNVTIPYKEKIIPYLYGLSPAAEKIGAVNTVINRDGRLFGYNTDYYGMSMLIEKSGVSIKDKKLVITGSGGTAKTTLAVAEDMGAGEIIRVSRTKKSGFVTYDELYALHGDAAVIINTTPVGMFPNVMSCPVDISAFDRPSLVIDAVYNPLNTMLVTNARKQGISAAGGLYMLCAQAVASCEIFTGEKAAANMIDSVYDRLLYEKSNIVLTGMPGCGKTTVGKILARLLQREFIDTDEEIVKRTGMSIPEYFSKYGEKKFRDTESSVINDICGIYGGVIATGGGAVLRGENVQRLKMNGIIYFIDRPLGQLMPSADRPLAGDRKKINQLYEKRYAVYCDSADKIIRSDGICEHTVIEIERLHKFENTCD